MLGADLGLGPTLEAVALHLTWIAGSLQVWMFNYLGSDPGDQYFDHLSCHLELLVVSLTCCKHVLQPEELLSLGWRDDSHHHLVPNIVRFLQLSRNVRLPAHHQVYLLSKLTPSVSSPIPVVWVGVQGDWERTGGRGPGFSYFILYPVCQGQYHSPSPTIDWLSSTSYKPWIILNS